MALPSRPDGLDPRVYDHLGEVPGDLFGARLFGSVELVERYAREWALELARDLELAAAFRESGDGGAPAETLGARLGLDPGFREPLAWWLEQLAGHGELHAAGAPGAPGGRRYRLAGPLREPHRAPVREAALAHDPANAPFLELLDLAGEAWPRVARGEVSGEAALLASAHVSLWARFFSNDNPVYALNNRLAAVAAVHRLPGAGGARVLEVGAGAGSASSALLEALEARGELGRLALYRVTEPAALLRRRAERDLARRWPEVPVEAGALDIDLPWDEQGVEPGSLDLVFGVNVLHVARDLQASLGRARSALAPGGRVVLGECLRPRPGQALAVEMIFLLLEDFRDVVTDPELRPTPGFLTPELWVAQLEAAGFTGVEVVPDVRVLRDFYSRFTTGVLCARA